MLLDYLGQLFSYLNMSTNAQSKRMTSLPLPVNQSFIEKSIIAQLPQSPSERENMAYLQNLVTLLKEELEYYKKQAFGKKKNLQEGESSSQLQTLRSQNQEQKRIIKNISEELRIRKKSQYGKDLTAECQRLQFINQKLQSQNIRLQAESEQLRSELMQAKNSGPNEDERWKGLEMRLKELTQTNLEYKQEMEALTVQLQKLRRENVIDRAGRRSGEGLRSDRSRYSTTNIHQSRALSELELIEGERFNLKLSQKNKEYQQLYLKFQSVQNELHTQQELNADLERERRFLAERLSDIQIHTQGDEVVGELENKLVLMSTELMRLGNLSRTKSQQNRDLSIKMKELLLRRENLEREVIERDKLILNYKEELRLMEVRGVAESRVERESQVRERNEKWSKEAERLSIALKQKVEALKNCEIKSAIFQEKLSRLQKENSELQKENKQLSTSRDRNKSLHTKILNLQAEVNYFKEANSGLKDEMKRYQNKFYEHRSDVEKLARQKQESRHANLQLQQKVTSLQEELRRTQLQLDDKTQELRENAHKGQQRSMIKTNEIKKLEEKVMVLEKEVQRGARSRAEQPKYEELLRDLQKLEGVQMGLKLQISSYEEKVAMLAQENERLAFQLANLQQQKAEFQKIRFQSEQRERKVRDLQMEVDNLAGRERRIKEQAEGLREKLRSSALMQRQQENWEFKNRQLRDEIDVLTTKISLKDEEFRNLNQRYIRESAEKYALKLKNEELSIKIGYSSQSQSSAPLRHNFEVQIQKLGEQLRQKNTHLLTLQSEARQSQQIYSTLSGEVQRLNSALESKVRELIACRKQNDLLQHKVRSCEESLQQRNMTQMNSQKSIAEAQSKTKIQFCQGKIRNYQGQLQLLRQRYEKLRKQTSNYEHKSSQLLQEKQMLQQRVNDMEFQLGERSSNFKHVEQSFKLTILEVKKSNERLEQTLRQIQTNYIAKLEGKQYELENLRRERDGLEVKTREMERKIQGLERKYGSEIEEKNIYINNLTSNREEVAQTRRVKEQYSKQIATLLQEMQKLKTSKDLQQRQLQKVMGELRGYQQQYSNAIKQNSESNQAVEVLSVQIERLNGALLEYGERMSESSRKCSRLDSQNSQLKKELDDALAKLEDRERGLNSERMDGRDKISKLEEMNRELTYQLREKSKDSQRFIQRIQLLQRTSQEASKQQIKAVAEQIRLLREGNQRLQSKLIVITRENEQLVTQLEYKRAKNSSEDDEKMRIIGNYEATIKYMKEENAALVAEKTRVNVEYEKINKICHEIQERSKLVEEKARVFEDRCRRMEERERVLEERARNGEDGVRGRVQEKLQLEQRALQAEQRCIQFEQKIVQIQQRGSQIDQKSVQAEQKLLAAMDQVSRLQILLKAKQSQCQRLRNGQQYYGSNEAMRDKRGIFVIKQASQMDQRSRSASGNGLQPPSRHPPNPQASDLQHRYDLLDSLQKKLSADNECLRKKTVQYEFKMAKLKEQFDLINRLIQEYREENDKLKENNRVLSRGNHFMSSHSSNFNSPQHSSIMQQHHRSALSPQPRGQQQLARSKLLQEIDRLNKVNSGLQSEIHDLRLNSTDAVSLRRRYQQSLALMVLLFAEIQGLRGRAVISRQQQIISPKRDRG